MLIPAVSQRRGFHLLGIAGAVIVSVWAMSALAQPPGAQPPSMAPDPFVVPNGTPAELVQYLEQLRTLQPPMDSHNMMDFRRKLLRAVLEAANRILAQKATEEQTRAAVYAKVGALAVLDRMGDKEAAERLARLPEQLQTKGMTQLAREVETFLFENRLRRARTLKREELASLIDEIQKFLAGSPLGETDANLAMATANIAETTSDQAMAAKTYRDFGKLLSASEDKKVAKMGAMMAGAARRLTLVGQPMPIDGQSIDGQAFDWSKYRGKVVLIDFWATWCGPCVAEFPNIRKNYEAYRDRGFEVIGVSIDNDREQLKAFLEEHKVPWTVLFDEALGDKSLATQYGIFAIPAMMLIGTDGKVITTEVRGPLLERELAKLLGPAEESKDRDANQ